jgi:hypothetical protein
MSVPIKVESFPRGRLISIDHSATDEEFRRWQQLRTEVVVRAYYNRSALIITLSPTTLSWAASIAIEHNLHYSEIICDEIQLSLLQIPSCSRGLLEDVSTDEEFVRGLLWLSYPIDNIEDQASQICRIRMKTQTNEQDLCETDYEVLTCEADGLMIIWCNGDLSSTEFNEFLDNSASDRGFRIEKIP